MDRNLTLKKELKWLLVLNLDVRGTAVVMVICAIMEENVWRSTMDILVIALAQPMKGPSAKKVGKDLWSEAFTGFWMFVTQYHPHQLVVHRATSGCSNMSFPLSIVFTLSGLEWLQYSKIKIVLVLLLFKLSAVSQFLYSVAYNMVQTFTNRAESFPDSSLPVSECFICLILNFIWFCPP